MSFLIEILSLTVRPEALASQLHGEGECFAPPIYLFLKKRQIASSKAEAEVEAGAEAEGEAEAEAEAEAKAEAEAEAEAEGEAESGAKHTA